MTAISDQSTFQALHAVAAAGISRPPSAWDRFVDRATRALAWSFGAGTILLLLFIIYKIGLSAVPAVQKHGASLVTTPTWAPDRTIEVNDVTTRAPIYGLRNAIFGTVYTSGIALGVATVLGVSIAIFLSQNFVSRRLEVLFKNVVELLAAIPSVVYGLWGMYVVIPVLRPGADALAEKVGAWLPLFRGNLSSAGVLPAALVLAIMVLPTISAISYDALTSVSPKLKEAAFGLGATRWETILKVTVPTALPGIFGSVILGFGRALGETMALAMLLGNVDEFHFSLLSRGNTLAALIANTFPETSSADKDTIDVLLFAGMLLLAITLAVNVIGAAIVQFAGRGRKGARQ
jgi:phosphate transport system permease protein